MDLPGGSVVEYVNDPFGRRIAKKLDGKVVEKYLWQGMTRLLAVTDGWNSLLCRFAYADARVPAAMEWGGRTYYLSYDQVGSLRQVTDSAGKAVKIVEYDSFGNVVRDSAPGFFLPLGFAGGLIDCHSGLVRFGYRDYAPGIGRWTAKDPLGFAGGDVDLFGYVGNDPVNFIDAEGLSSLELLGKKAITFAGKKIGRKAGQEIAVSKEGENILGSGIGYAIAGGITGAAAGAVAGGAAFLGIGAIPGALVGGFIGATSGFGAGTIIGATKEISGFNDFSGELNDRFDKDNVPVVWPIFGLIKPNKPEA